MTTADLAAYARDGFLVLEDFVSGEDCDALQARAAELVAEGENGFVRDALDIGGLAEALARLDPPTAARMGARASESVASLTPAAMAAEYLALYQRLLHR